MILLLASALTPASGDQPQATLGASEQPDGKIIFYRRGSLNGAALACPIRYQGNELIELGRSKSFEWPVTAGRYILENKTSSVEVSVMPGETRYVRCQIKTGFLTGRAELQIVDGTEYTKLKDKFEQPGT